MRRNLKSLAVIFVISACVVGLSVWLGPTEASAQHRITDEQKRQFALDDIRRAIEDQTRWEVEQYNLRVNAENSARASVSTVQPSVAPKRWATDMEIDRQGRLRTYYILWSDGSVTNGGTLP